MKRRNLLKAAALAPVPLAAQDVGLGVRKGPSTRLEAPYTTVKYGALAPPSVDGAMS